MSDHCPTCGSDKPEVRYVSDFGKWRPPSLYIELDDAILKMIACRDAFHDTPKAPPAVAGLTSDESDAVVPDRDCAACAHKLPLGATFATCHACLFPEDTLAPNVSPHDTMDVGSDSTPAPTDYTSFITPAPTPDAVEEACNADTSNRETIVDGLLGSCTKSEIDAWNLHVEFVESLRATIADLRRDLELANMEARDNKAHADDFLTDARRAEAKCAAMERVVEAARGWREAAFDQGSVLIGEETVAAEKFDIEIAALDDLKAAS